VWGGPVALEGQVCYSMHDSPCMCRVGQNRISYMYIVHDRMHGNFPANKMCVHHTYVHMYGGGQP
jgi:hypothetical protein